MRPIGDATAMLITFDTLVKFAQQGWDYPLPNDAAARHAILNWLLENKIPLMTMTTQDQLNELVGKADE